MKEPITLLDAPADRRSEDVPIALPKIDDYYAWAYRQADYLRTGRFHLLDLPNVIDEIETVARNEVRSLRSNLVVTLTHMLKWDHQATKRSRSWANSIDEHRERVREDLQDSPSMTSKRDEIVEQAYAHAKRRASRETRLAPRIFPDTCPYTWAQIMTAPYDLDEH